MTEIIIPSSLILASIILFIGGCILKQSTLEDKGSTLCGFLSGWLVMIGIYLMLPKEPKALDVYRGNTTLEVTSVNGVPTDSVVVFKQK